MSATPRHMAAIALANAMTRRATGPGRGVGRFRADDDGCFVLGRADVAVAEERLERGEDPRAARARAGAACREAIAEA